MGYLSAWFTRYFSDPQAVLMAVLLIVGLGVIVLFGDMLAPALAAVVIAYLLEGVVRILERRGARRGIGVLLVFVLFVAFLVFLFFGLTPLLWTQTAELVRELPEYIGAGREAVSKLPEHYPFITEDQVDGAMEAVRRELMGMGQRVLSVSLSSIPGILTVIIYLVLVPLLVFFFLKDKARIVGWLAGFLPHERGLATQVWREVDQQIGNYVRGKFWEILIVGAVTFVVFALLGLKYSMLLAVLVGLSVIIPYIGAATVTIPVAVIAYFQWGWSPEFAWVVVAYGIIQALDGNVLVPLLFSEVVNLHPVAIIVAILFFGGIWGFWGVFFAIPLATLVSALITAWPRPPAPEDGEGLYPPSADVADGG